MTDLTSTVNDKGKAKETNQDDDQALAKVYESFDFEPLWKRLSDALDRLKGDPGAAQILLPLIEVS